ncbi:MAG: hypothetical protein DWI29_01885 [Planctomycetota bacterium]|nr:MAG: hypothetical protein DWI29_01885 [Planctomycetota bacterium]
MGKLTDILGSNSGFFNNWTDVKAADDFGPIPPGTYVCHITKGELATSRRKQTPCYTLTFRVIEGDFVGRLLWHEIWLTLAAKAQAKRDFDKLSFTDPERQVEQPIPPDRIRCRVKVVIHKDDNGTEHNNVKSFEVVGIDTPKADPFAPGAGESSTGGPAT